MKRITAGILLAILAGCAQQSNEPLPETRPVLSVNECERIIEDPQATDSDALSAIQDIRTYPLAAVAVQFWSDIANGTQHSDLLRRFAAVQIFERYVQPKWTLGQIGAVLDHPRG